MPNPQKPTDANETAARQTASLPADSATQDFRPAVAHAEQAKSASVLVPGYRVLNVLGRGGMGVVYKAVQEKANRLVALKMILAGAHADQQDKLRFRLEAEAAAKLSHPNIVQLYEVGETAEGFPFFSLEFVSGGTLAERLQQSPLRPGEAASLVEALARAMQYAHERGIVHRDLKPLNVLLEGPSPEAVSWGQALNKVQETMVKKPGTPTINSAKDLSARSRSYPPAESRALTPKISDFGLAKQLDSDDGLTRTGAIMGSPAYMAPEQAFGQSKSVGPAADIYALGAILYECLTGRPPFKGATVADTLEQVRTMEPITLKQFVKEIPSDLETICLHCLHKDPQRRYVSAAALADDLRRYQEQKPISVRPVSDAERVWRWCRRNPGWAGMIASVAVLAFTLIGGLSYGIVTIADERDQRDEQRKKAEVEEKKAKVAKELAESEERKAKIAQKKAEEEEDNAKRQTALAKARLDESIQAVGLFVTDAKTFCDDALVPGDSRTRLYQVLIDHLEKQAAGQEVGKPTVDSLRNRVWMYRNIATVWSSFGMTDKGMVYLKKGLHAADEWLKLEPSNAHAMSHQALLNYSLADHLTMVNPKAGRDKHLETLALRRKLLDNPEVDQFTPGKSIADLAESLDVLQQFEESLKLRERVFNLCVERKLPTFGALDNWSLTCQKAAEFSTDYETKRTLWMKAADLANEAMIQRPGSRVTLSRQAKIMKDLGELEFNHGKLAEKAKQPNQAERHFTQAQLHFIQLANLSKRLATAQELVERLREYSRSFYMLGLIDRQSGRLDAARENFKICLHIREQCLRDYKHNLYEEQMQYDLVFALVAVGDHARAYEFATERIAKNKKNASNLYRLACILSLCIPAVEEARRPQRLTPDDRKLQEMYRDKALSCLESAFTAGWSNAYHTTVDADLAPIREDPRFQAILAKHGKKQ